MAFTFERQWYDDAPKPCTSSTGGASAAPTATYDVSMLVTPASAAQASVGA